MLHLGVMDEVVERLDPRPEIGLGLRVFHGLTYGSVEVARLFHLELHDHTVRASTIVVGQHPGLELDPTSRQELITLLEVFD